MKKRITLAVIALALMALFFTSCSASPAREKATADTAQSAPAMANEADDMQYSYDESAAEEAVMEDSMEMEAEAPQAAAGGIGELPNTNMPQENGRKLVYNATFSIETKEFQKDYSTIKSKLSAVGGYVEYEDTSTNRTDYGEYRYANMTLRVPSSKYDAFLEDLSGTGSVVNKQISTDDITDQYFDTQARIDILEERRLRLMDHLKSATKTADIIELESELSEVLYELDSYKGNARQMDNMVNYTKVDVNLTEVVTSAAISPTGDPVGERANSAYQLSLTSVGAFVEDFAVGMAAAAPVLMLLGIITVIVLVILYLIKTLRKKYNNRKQKNNMI